MLVLAAGVSLVWTPYPPGAIDVPRRLLEPSPIHWLGTEMLGRDIVSQLLAGARVSILVGVIAVGIGLSLGVALGLVAASARELSRTRSCVCATSHSRFPRSCWRSC